MTWRREKPTAAAKRRREAVNTGVILARLDSVIDRLEGVYQQLAQEMAKREGDGRA